MNGWPVLSIMTWAPFVGAVLIMFTARHRPLLVRVLALVTMFAQGLYTFMNMGQSSALFRTYFRHDDRELLSLLMVGHRRRKVLMRRLCRRRLRLRLALGFLVRGATEFAGRIGGCMEFRLQAAPFADFCGRAVGSSMAA